MTSWLLGRPSGLPRFAPYLLTLRRCASNGNPYGNISPEGILLSGEIGAGEPVRSVSRKYQISLPHPRVFRHIPMAQMKIKDNPCKLSIQYAQCHVFDEASTKYLDKYEHPFAKSVLNMYIKKKETPLWHKVFARPEAKPFPCRVATKRIRHAFLDALAYHGYDRDGRKITKDNSSVIAALHGTVKLVCGDPKAACNIKFADLLEQAKLVVAGIEPMLARDKNGQYIIAPRQQTRNPNNKSNKSNRSYDNNNTGTRSGTRPARRY
ncbi:uncharacterized protein F4807DRAFT_346594 [Annulohypoxylon truncatum]|uniref:uncharacterized protein n=1 Tax=Annulohypoxylon truncatum TaxID=327061 RepID=UPI0020083E7F|nr:uncharacterized protein F4807DRAFT_346594 [Annulohypoxylon truncatum]KAI1212705.1 hypothetical protein F4807DRAFT_346594 [Annulohypoxylon truncatum]